MKIHLVKIKYVIFLIILFFGANNTYSQSVITRTDSIPVYLVVNEEFAKILDSFIIHEQQYDYYYSTVRFLLILECNEKRSSFTLFSGNRCQDSVIIFEEPLNIYMEKEGIIFYNNHTFVCLFYDDICELLLKQSNMKQFVYYKRTTIKPIKETEIHEDIDIFPSIWTYEWNNGVFEEIMKTDADGW
jgi:hypothetical protein